MPSTTIKDAEALLRKNHLVKYIPLTKKESKACIVVWLEAYKLLNEARCQILQSLTDDDAFQFKMVSNQYSKEKDHRFLSAEKLFDSLANNIGNYDYRGFPEITEAKIRAAIKALENKKLDKAYAGLFSSPANTITEGSTAFKILWLDEHGILQESNCKKLRPTRSNEDGLTRVLEQYNQDFEKEPFKEAAQRFFDIMTNPAIPSVKIKEYADIWITLAKERLEEYITSVPDVPFAKALVILKQGGVNFKDYTPWLSQSKHPKTPPQYLATGLVCLHKEGLNNETYRGYLLDSEYPHFFAQSLVKLKEKQKLNETICTLLRKHSREAPQLTSAFLRLSDDGVPDSEIYSLLEPHPKLALAIAELYCWRHEEQRLNPEHFTFFKECLSTCFNYYCGGKQQDWVLEAQNIAAKFCELIEMFPNEQFKKIFIFIKQANESQRANFTAIVDLFLLFGKKGKLTFDNKQHCFKFLFLFYPLIDWDFLDTFHIFENAIGLENFNLLISIQSDKIGLLQLALSMLQNNSLPADRAPQNFNQILKFLTTRSCLKEELNSEMQTLLTQQKATIPKGNHSMVKPPVNFKVFKSSEPPSPESKEDNETFSAKGNKPAFGR